MVLNNNEDANLLLFFTYSFPFLMLPIRYLPSQIPGNTCFCFINSVLCFECFVYVLADSYRTLCPGDIVHTVDDREV
jgi:hypothetical protein